MNDEAEATGALDCEIGARIRHARLMRGLAQKDLAAVLGVSFQQIQKYEHGTNRVPASALILLARALDLAPDALMGAHEPEATIEWALLSEDGAHDLLRSLSRINSPQDRAILLELARSLRSLGGELT